jgi:hypothetical protein
MSVSEIAEIVGTSMHSIKEFNAIEHKAPDLAAEVKAGKKPLKTAHKEAKLKALLRGR